MTRAISNKQVTRGHGTRLKLLRRSSPQPAPQSLVLFQPENAIPQPSEVKLTQFEIKELQRLNKVAEIEGGNNHDNVKSSQIKTLLEEGTLGAGLVFKNATKLFDRLNDDNDPMFKELTPLKRAEMLLILMRTFALAIEKNQLLNGRPGSHSLIESIRGESSLDEQHQEIERILTGRSVTIKR